jgi:putative endonuclease
MTHYVYILVSLVDGSWYYGQTNSLENRLERHNAGLEKYTKTKKPWKFLWTKEVGSRAEAMRFERKLKNMKSRKQVLEFMGKG